MYRSQPSRRVQPVHSGGMEDGGERKEQALQQAEDALWKIPRSLEGIKRKDFNPVQLALQMMDTSSLGKSYDEFQESFERLNASLDGIVDEYYGGFNDSILTFSGLQERIQDASGSVNGVKGGLQRVRRMILEERGSLDQLYAKSTQLGAIVAILKRLEDAKRVREEVAAYAKEKRFLTAAGKLVEDMQFVFDAQLTPIEALSGLRQQLEAEKAELLQRIIDELHSHVYLKSPYCERRMGTEADEGSRPGRQRIRRARKARRTQESGGGDDEGSPEADSFAYVEMLLESLATLESTGMALQEIKGAISRELSRLIDGVVAEVEERNRALLGRAGAQADDEVLHDFARILFARLEAVLEYHEYVLDVAGHVGGGERYSLTSPQALHASRHASLPYALADVWEAVKTEVLALLRNYLVADDAQAGAAAEAHGAGMRDLFHMERGDVGGAVEALYAQVEAQFQDLTAAAPDRRRELTAPAVVDEYADAQNSLQHKLLAAPDIEHAPALLGMALEFTRRVAPMLAEPSPSVTSPPGLSPAVRRSVGGDMSPSSGLPSVSDADEFLQAFFTKTYLAHAEAQATRLFDAVTAASDAFEIDPGTRFGGRPVLRGAAALVPLLQRFGTLLNSLDMFRGANWGILLDLAARFYDMCLALFRDTVRSPEGQTYLSVRWAESLDMMQLFDRRMRLGVRDAD
ncbi:exocyst subunit, partial [Coemansia sp. RSA 2618]